MGELIGSNDQQRASGSAGSRCSKDIGWLLFISRSASLSGFHSEGKKLRSRTSKLPLSTFREHTRGSQRNTSHLTTANPGKDSGHSTITAAEG